MSGRETADSRHEERRYRGAHGRASARGLLAGVRGNRVDDRADAGLGRSATGGGASSASPVTGLPRLGDRGGEGLGSGPEPGIGVPAPLSEEGTSTGPAGPPRIALVPFSRTRPARLPGAGSAHREEHKVTGGAAVPSWRGTHVQLAAGRTQSGHRCRSPLPLPVPSESSGTDCCSSTLRKECTTG